MPNTSNMVEIDHVREKLIELVNDARMNAHWHGAKDPIKYMVDMLIANGVTIPVLCKDCRKCSTWDDVITKQPQYVCRLWHGATREVSADGFCDAGERRTDG